LNLDFDHTLFVFRQSLPIFTLGLTDITPINASHPDHKYSLVVAGYDGNFLYAVVNTEDAAAIFKLSKAGGEFIFPSGRVKLSSILKNLFCKQCEWPCSTNSCHSFNLIRFVVKII